jgi:hypothetical protein
LVIVGPTPVKVKMLLLEPSWALIAEKELDGAVLGALFTLFT